MRYKKPNLLKKLFDNKGLSDEELTQKFFKILSIFTGIIVFSIILMVFFAPKIGFLFGLLSSRRNEQEKPISIKPNPPVFINAPKAVNTNKTTLTGYAVAGATVKLFVNGPQKSEAIVNNDGQFTLSDIPLNSGKNTLFAKLTDSQNIESEPSKTFYITVDTEKPKIELFNLKDGDTIKNLDRRIILKGRLSEQAVLKINGRTAIIKPDLNFEFVMGVDEGEVKLTLEAIDLAGNKKEEILKVTYQKTSV